jgi:hypothetical protein
LIPETDISSYFVPQIRINLLKLRDLSPNYRTFAVRHAFTNLTLDYLIRGVGNINDHNDRLISADFSVAANLFYGGKINKEGIDAIEKKINQMS